MANPDVARGLIPSRTLQGVPYCGQVQTFLATGDTGAIYIGSPVKHGGTSAVFNDHRYTTVAGGFTTADTVIGVCVGVEAVTRESDVFRATSTDRLIHVCTDPFMLFEVQDSQGATASAVVAAEVGNVADLINEGGSTITGRSTIELDGNTATGTFGDQDVQIIEIIRRPDNEIGGNAAYLVRLLNHYFNTTVAA